MKSNLTSTSLKSKKQKLAPAKDPVLEKKARTAGLEEIDSLFDDLKSKKVERNEKLDGLSASSSSCKISKKNQKESDKTYRRSDEEDMRIKSRDTTDEVNLPHGVIKSNNPRIIISPEAPVERIDPESGYKVYKAHILKVGEGGGTDLCPFDCDCCF